MKRLILSVMTLLLALLWGFGPAENVAYAQTGIGQFWNVEFFNDPYLNGTPVLRRQDASINFNWGTGSPAAGVNADNFSARWSTSGSLPSGTYRFVITADDGIHLWVDGRLLIDTYDDPRPAEQLSVDVVLSGGHHNLQIDYREATGDAYIFVNWGLASNVPLNPAPAPLPPSSGTWRADYYNNAILSGAPSLTRFENTPSQNWGLGSPAPGINADFFSVRWSATLALGGTYNLTVRADDGVRVYVNGVLYINEWHGATGQAYSNSFTVPAGNHNVVIELYENEGAAFLDYNLSPVSGSGGGFPAPSGMWFTQYYNNRNLAGNPIWTTNETGPSHNWGTGGPGNGVPSENFSARWSTTENIMAGTYRVDVQADDGVRVYINNQLLIDQWRTSDGSQIYSSTIALPGGPTPIVVEYFEVTGLAFLNYTLNRVSGSVTPPVTNEPNVVVTTGRLNVRSGPGLSYPPLTRITLNDRLPMTGRNASNTWVQIRLTDGSNGWVSAAFVRTTGLDLVPVVNAPAVPAPDASGYSLQTTANLSLRTQATTVSRRLTVIPRGTTVEILGRNSSTTWWQVRYDGATGWVSGQFVALPAGMDVNRIPLR